MPLQDSFGKNRRQEPLGSDPPSKADLSFLMERAAQTAPQVLILRWQTEFSQFVLSISYVDGPNGEPTWEFATGEDPAAEIFWSVTTENPGEIHRLIMKRVAPQPSQTAAPIQKTPDPPAPSAVVQDAQNYRRLADDELFANRYRVLTQIGHGGMGRIYQAVDVTASRVVALKVLHPHLIEDEAARRRFDREAKATIHLRHPNLLIVHDYGFSDEGLPFIAMEFLDGEVLHKILTIDGPLEIRRFLQIFLQVCSALYHAHMNRVIHRDVKPGNIMLIKVDRNNDLVKLVDFGIAKIVRADGRTMQRLTQTGDVLGSPFYMSPEQCMGRDLDPRSDIYSLGCVMYEAISGIRPFDSPNALSTMQLQVTTPPKPFSEVCPKLGIPPQIESVIFRTLEKDPANRFQTAKELGQRLERMLTVDKINLDNEWISEQTKSGTFYTVRPSKGEQEKSDFTKVLTLLRDCQLINGNEYRQAVQLLGTHGMEVTRFLLDSGKVTEQTLHAAVQCERLIERGECKVELAVIALHYCCKNQVSLREAFNQLGWQMSISN